MAFPETRWTLVRSARDSADARGQLLGMYWHPVYVYLRRRGLDPAAAEDAVQGLFTRLLERDFPAGVDPARGRLRSYLRAAADHYLVNEHARATAAKRGAGAEHVPLDTEWAERHLAGVAADPEAAFEQEWAAALVARALDALRAELATRSAILRYFEQVEPPPYAEAAAACGLSLSAFKSALHRARARFRELLRAEVARATPDEAAIDEEMARLVGALRR